MSRSTALGIVPDRTPIQLAEYSNSWGWSASIWDRLVKHLYGFEGSLYWGEGEKYLNRLWQEIEEQPEWVQAANVLTFDTGVIPGQAYLWAAEMLEEFDRRLPVPDTHANHVPAVAALLRTLPEVPFFGMWGTSVTDNPFNPWDNEKDEYMGGLPLSELYVLGRHRVYIEEP